MIKLRSKSSGRIAMTGVDGMTVAKSEMSQLKLNHKEVKSD
jgi:hypothetical protein